MTSPPRSLFLLAVLAVAFGMPSVAAADDGFLATDGIGVPLRVPDYTFPSFLVLGLSPMPAAPLGHHNYAFELHYSKVNDFQVSSTVEDYLSETRGDTRRRLDETDVEAILGLPEGEAFYIDGEFDFVNFTFHYGVSDRLDVGFRVYYIGYTGGTLDGTIFDFHDTYDFGQQGRNFVEDDQFQIVFGAKDATSLVALERGSSGGFSDPSFLFRYAFPRLGNGWRFSLSGGIKMPLASQTDFLSSGSWDIGAQLNVDKRWNRNAMILNLGYVLPGEFRLTDFNPAPLPSLHLSWIHRLKRFESTRIMLQGLFAEHPFRDLVDSDLSKGEVQLTLAMKWDTQLGVFGLGLTENLLNMDNTPDIGLHFSWGYLGTRKKYRELAQLP